MKHRQDSGTKPFAFALLLSASLSLLTACQPQSTPVATSPASQTSGVTRSEHQSAQSSSQTALDPQAFSGATVKVLRGADGTRLRINLASAGFKTQAFDCGNISTLSISFDGLGSFGGDGPSATPDGTGSCSFTTNAIVGLPAGRTRIINLEARNSDFVTIGTLSTAFDIVDGQTSSFEINYRTTAMAKIFKALMTHANPLGQVYATRISIADMQEWVDDRIGVDNGDSFPYTYDTHPMLLNFTAIANAIVDNGGLLPETTPADAILEPGEVVVNIEGIDAGEDDVRVWIKDPASDRVFISLPDDEEVVTFDDVIPGQTWTVEVKQGSNVFTQAVTPSAGGSIPLNFDLNGVTNYGSSWSLTPGGPYAGHINQIVTDNGGNLIAASEDGGVYLSDDDGASWTQVNNGIATADLDIDSLATNPADSINPYVYAGTGTGKVFRRNFVANETTWTQVDTGTVFPSGAPINRLYVKKSDSRFVLAGAYYGGVAECLNSDSAPFTITNLVNSGNDYTGNPITGFTEDDSGNIYLASKGFGVYRTTTPGAPGSGWTQLSTPGDPYITSIDFDSSNDKLQLGSYTGHIYTGSAPSPTGWTDTTTGLSGMPIWDILTTSSKFYAVTYAGLKLANDVAPADGQPDSAGFGAVSGGSNTYVSQNPNTPFLTSAVFNPGVPGALLVGTHGAGVQSVTGAIWSTASSGLHAAQVNALAKWGPTSVIYAGTYGGGVMRSIDSGSNWTAMLNVPPPSLASEGGFERRVNALLLRDDSSTHDLFMGTDAGVYYLNNINGSEAENSGWSTLGTSGMGDKRVRALHRLGNEYMLAGTETKLYQICMPGYPSCGTGVSAWTEILDNTSSIPAFSIASHPESSNYPYVGTEQGVYYNTDLDGSGSWVVNPFGAPGQRVIALATTPDDPDVVWAGLDPSNSQSPSDKFLYKNTGAGGGSWTAVTLPSSIKYVDSIVVDDSDASQIFIGTNDGVYYSNDHGATFTAFNSGPYSLYGIKVRSLAVDWTNQKLFAGTAGHSVASTLLTELLP